jgi:plastocyanin
MDTYATAGRKGPAKRIALLRLSVLAAIAVVGLAACAPAAFRTAGYGTAAGATSASSSMPMPMPAGKMASAGPATSTPPPPAVPAGAAEVGIVNFKFTAATVTIKGGGTIDWTNHDDIGHTVSFAGQGINSKVLQRNDRFSHTFDTPGTYTYICSIHPFMHGTVVVTG